MMLGSGGAYEAPYPYASKERCWEAAKQAASQYAPVQGFLCIPVDAPPNPTDVYGER